MKYRIRRVMNVSKTFLMELLPTRKGKKNDDAAYAQLWSNMLQEEEEKKERKKERT